MNQAFFVQGKSMLTEAPHFRGVYCERPFFCPSQPEAERINILSKQHWEEVEANNGLVIDLDKAKELIRLYRKIGDASLHLIEVSSVRSLEGQNGFLGYDISNDVFNTSLISPLCLKSWERPGDGPWAINPLFRLVGSYFSPKLNQFGLFDDFDTACFYLSCDQELEKIFHLWERGDVFSVIGLSERSIDT